MKDSTKAVIGAWSFMGWRAVGGFAWGSAVADGELFTRVLLGLMGALFVTDRAMRLWIKQPPEEPSAAEQLQATLNGEPLTQEEMAELSGVLKRAYERRKQPPPMAN